MVRHTTANRKPFRGSSRPQFSIDGEGTRRAPGHTFFQKRRFLRKSSEPTKTSKFPFRKFSVWLAESRTGLIKPLRTISRRHERLPQVGSKFRGSFLGHFSKKAKGNATRYLTQLYENDADSYAMLSNGLRRSSDLKTVEFRPKATSGLFLERRRLPSQWHRSRLRAANSGKAALKNLATRTESPKQYKPPNMTFSKIRFGSKHDDDNLYENRSKVAKWLEKLTRSGEFMASQTLQSMQSDF